MTQENIYNLSNEEAEQSILGSIILDRSCLEYTDELSHNDFSKEYHKHIYKSMIDLYRNNKPVDIITLTNDLKEKKLLEQVGGINYITSLSTIVPTTSNINHYIDIVKGLADKRRIIKASYDLIENLRNGKDIDSSKAIFEKESNIDVNAKRRSNPMRNIFSKIFDKMNDKKPKERIKTGIPIIDKCTNGFEKHELITIGAGSGVGKSAIALKIAINAYLQGKKVLIFSREMSDEQIAERILLSRTGISKENYDNNNYSEMDWKSAIDLMNAFSSNDNFLIDDTSSTVQMFKSEIRREKPDLVIVDYMQLVTPENKNDSRERQVATVSRELQQMARDFDCTIIQLSQLAEKGTGNFRPTGESYTRESRALYHDSHKVIYLHRVTEEKELEIAYKKLPALHERGSFEDVKDNIRKRAEKDIRFIEINVDKNRNGKVGSNYYWFKGENLEYYPVI